MTEHMLITEPIVSTILLWPVHCIPDHTHFFIGTRRMSFGSFWLCKYCTRVKWIPEDDNNGNKFSTNIKHYGIQAAYEQLLLTYPNVRKIILQLNSLYAPDGNVEYQDAVEKYLLTGTTSN